MTASTFSSFPMAGTDFRVPLNCIAEVREITRKPWIAESLAISASVMPSER